MSLPSFVKMVEVGPRDGLQNEALMLPTDVKIAFINQLSETGLQNIEVTSFVSPQWIPQLADSEKVFAGIHKKNGIAYPVLIPNVKGLMRALSVDVKEIAVFTTASETFSKKNTNRTVAQSLKEIADIMTIAKANALRVRAYVSCVLGCPYEGDIAAEKTAQVAKQLFDLGCDEISLGDTIGRGTPLKTQELIDVVARVIPLPQLAVHFHDTYGAALANIFAALQSGIHIIDASVAGLGGCPYAKGASGNVATEDVVYLLHEMQIETGIDLKKLIAVGNFISKELQRQSQSKVSRAMWLSKENKSV